MALSNDEFNKWGIDENGNMLPDDFGRMPRLKLHNLEPFDYDRPIKLSVIISFSSWRKEQLARTMETIAHQTFKDYEILICDMGSGQDLDEVYRAFDGKVRFYDKSITRDTWLSCPSRGIHEMLPYAKGDVIAFMQPEMLLHREAFWYLYNSHYEPIPNDYRIRYGDEDTFVNLRNSFLSKKHTWDLDDYNWHDDLKTVEDYTDFWEHREGLSGMTNRDNWSNPDRRNWIWWFISSAKRTSTLWEDLPILDGHGGIDIFLIRYKQLMRYTEIIPQICLAYHQEHNRASIAPERDDWVWNQDTFIAYLQKKGRL
jgi:glycosyltransferase involved in cell wall biosynthesis